MAADEIQEQIDIFMEKLKNSKVPKKAAGEAIVSGKSKKVKPPKKGEAPVFWDIGVTGFTSKDKGNYYYEKLLTAEGLVQTLHTPTYASEMSPSLKVIAIVFANTKWAAKMLAVVKNGEEAPKPLFQACVQLGLKLNEWGQSKDWKKVEKHLPDIESLENSDLEAIAAAGSVPWMGPEDTVLPFAPIDIPGNNESTHQTEDIPGASIFKEVALQCIVGKTSLLSIKVTVDGDQVVLAALPDVFETSVHTFTSDKGLILTGKQMTIHYQSDAPLTVKATVLLGPLTDTEGIKTETAEETEEPAQPDDHAKFLEGLVNIVNVLDETKLGQPPEQPIVLLKDKGEWSATLMTEIPQEKPLALPPWPPVEEKPGIILLTQPVKIRSPGGNKVAVPPTFISIPPGVVTIKEFIWTIPIDVSNDTKCQVAVGYGADTYIMSGTLASVSEAPPFKLDKGGVLKVSLQTAMPMEVWLELELKVEAPSPVFMMKLGQMLSQSNVEPAMPSKPLPESWDGKAVVKLEEPETDDDKL